MTDFLRHRDEAVFIRGYSAIFGRPSVPLDRNDGRREIVSWGAFDRIVRVPPLSLKFVAHHLESQCLASIYAGNLSIWVDELGLAFEAGPIRATWDNHSIVGAVVTGKLRGCSWSAVPSILRDEAIDGEEFTVIYKYESLAHLGPVAAPAYPDAVCWASHEHLEDMTSALAGVVEHWDRSAAQQRTEARRRPAIAASVRTQSRAQPEIPFAEYAGEPPAGVTAENWRWFADMDAAGRRAMMRGSRRGK